MDQNLLSLVTLVTPGQEELIYVIDISWISLTSRNQMGSNQR